MENTTYVALVKTWLKYWWYKFLRMPFHGSYFFMALARPNLIGKIRAVSENLQKEHMILGTHLSLNSFNRRVHQPNVYAKVYFTFDAPTWTNTMFGGFTQDIEKRKDPSNTVFVQVGASKVNCIINYNNIRLINLKKTLTKTSTS